MLRKTFIALAVLGALWGCASSGQRATKTPENGNRPPVIVDYYAAEKIRPGQTWRVYLRAKDEDGDMDYIAAVLDQPGFGLSPTSKTRINGEDRAELAGYLFLRTPADQDLTSGKTKNTLTVLIRDQQGNASKNLELPLIFANVPPENVPDQWQAAVQHRLGRMMIKVGRPAQQWTGDR